MKPLLALLLAAVGLLAAAGCNDPVLDAQIAALPGEVPGIRTGPTHRAGQPCTDCHSAYGGRSPEFSLAGTVFQKPTNKVAVGGLIVHVVDANGATQDLTSNCAGNFYVTTTQWSPTWPLFVTLEDPQAGTSLRMLGKIGRDSSCASCHVDPSGENSPGHVWLTNDPSVPDATPPPLNCGR
jgi:hypothetical protein